MAKTTSADLELKKASAKYTKAKAAVVESPTPAREKAYRKAKTELAFARQAHAEQRRAPGRPGDAAVEVKAVAAKAGTNTTRRKK